MNLPQMTIITGSSGIACILLTYILFLNRRFDRRLQQEMESHQQYKRQFQENLASLQESEKKSWSLFKTIPSVIFTGYLDGSAEFLSDKFEALTGYPVEEFNSHRMKWPAIILSEDAAHFKAAFKEALKGDHLYLREYRIKTASESIRWIRERGYINCDDHGKVDYVTGICSDVTHEHEMATLAKSEQNFRLLVSTIPSVVFRGYADWSIDFFEDKFEKISGYAINAFNSKKMKWSDIILPEDLEGAKEIFKEALKGDRSYMREYRIRIKSGTVRWVRERARITCDESGLIQHVSGICTDITREHEISPSLEKKLHRNEIILNSLGEGLFELDWSGEVSFINPAALEMIGYQGKDVVGQNLHELIHHKKADGSPYPAEDCPILATLRDGKERKERDDVFWTKRGEALPVAYMTTPIVDAGTVVGVLVTFRDITWRKQAETELQKSSQFLENVIDSSAEAICLVDPHGQVTKWNKAAEVIYGYTFKELQGKPAFDLYADKEELAKMIGQLRRDGHVNDYKISMKRKAGSIFTASLSIKVMRDETGRNLGSVTIARDLTEVKDREAMLQALVDESKQRHRNMALLQEMSETLHSCQTSEETYSAIANFVPQLFPGYGGGLYILNDSKDLFEMTATWGDASSLEMVFGHDECCSLRRTRAYLVHDSKTSINCRHLSSEMPGSYVCVPIMALGEVMGIFHLQKEASEEPDQINAIWQFTTNVVEALAMALANLKLQETLRNQAIRDGLTGLFNRRYLEETLKRGVRRNKRADSPLGVIMMDLDHFKTYNDTYGHQAGDELLVALGHMIQNQARREDIACRYGGEEFLLIMPGASLKVTLERAQILNDSVKRLHTHNQALKPITISAGVAIFPGHGATGKEVIRAADAALYRAKEEGRDRVIVANNPAKGHGPPALIST